MRSTACWSSCRVSIDMNAVTIVAETGIPASEARVCTSARSSPAAMNTNSAMNTITGLRSTNTPNAANNSAKPCPTCAAMRVARAYGIVMARSARSTRPPSMGNAGIRLNTSIAMFANRRNSSRPLSARSIACSGVTPRPTSAAPSAVARMTFTPGQPHDPLLHGLLGHALQARHAADREQHDLARLNAEPSRRERVPELVEQHAQEHEQQLAHGEERRVGATLEDRQPRHHEQEGDVDLDPDSGERDEAERPAHWRDLR